MNTWRHVRVPVLRVKYTDDVNGNKVWAAAVVLSGDT